MIELGGKRLCENCFSEVGGKSCSQCGYNAETSGCDPLTLKPGSILRGKYIVGKCLGKGGFGITYLAYDINAEKKVAIKEYYPMGLALRTIGDPTVQVSNSKNAAVFRDGAEKFYEEARLVSRFNGNPNIVSVYEFFYENDTVYFSMEYLEGITLSDYVSQKGNLSSTQALFIADNIANALMAAHSASVLHRDISPDNIMLCSSGEVKLIDFGAARQVIAEQSQSFSVILKPGFAPLEQYQKKGNQGAWTDIYSLGASIFYALTGIIPEDPMSRLDEETTFDENRYNIFPDLWKVIVKATMLKIPDRYPDIFEMRKALNSINAARQPIFMPENNIPQGEPSFHTAVPFGQTSAVSQPNILPTAGAVQYTANVPVQGEIPPKKPGFFAAHKKPIIAAASGAGTAAAAAVILAVALNSGGKPDDSYVQPYNSMYSSLPESISAQEPVTTPKPVTTPEPSTTTPKPATTTPKPATTTPKPATTTPKPATTTPKPVTTTPKPATTTPKPATTTPKPATTTPKTTKTTTKPVVSEPEEVKSVEIGGESYSTDLTSLDLSGKGLKDSDVKNLKYMKNLDTLILNDNNITDISFVKKMPNLKYLYFHNNKVSDISAVKNLSGLIGIGGNGTPVSDISALKGKKNLDNVWFCDTYITDISPLSGCTKMTELGFNNCNLYGDISALENMDNLWKICLNNCGISDISALSDKFDLEYIYLGYNWISDVSPLWDCASIKEIYLDNNSITEASIDLAGLTVDGIIDLSGNGLTKEQADEIAEYLSLSGNLEMLYY